MKEPFTNIDCFNAATGCILADLYGVFPRRFPITPADYQRKLATDGRIPGHCDWTEQGIKATCLVSETIEYLCAEKIIRRMPCAQEPRQHLVLTAKGFSVLSSAAPDDVTLPPDTLGQRLASLGDHASKSVVSSAIASIFKLIAG